MTDPAKTHLTEQIFDQSFDFVNATAGDLHLPPCSKAVNTGLNAPIVDLGIATDFDGQIRIQDGRIDLGALESPQLAGSIAPIGPVCHADSSGKIAFYLTNGCLPAQLAWQKNGLAGSDSTGLAAGVYAVTLTDGRGKTLLDTLQIHGSSPQVSIAGDSINCFGESPAQLAATVAGGVDPLAFAWNSGQKSPEISGLGGGNYVLTVTDALGCTVLDSAFVLETPPIEASFAIAQATWAGGQNGAASVDIFAGLAPFSKKWSTGDTTNLISGLAPGAYQFSVTDAAGCERIFEIEVGFGTATDDLAEAKISLAPNPSDGLAELFIDCRQIVGELVIEVFDPLGRTVFSKNTMASASIRTPIDLRAEPRGVYFLTLRSGSSNRFWKLVKQ